MKVAIVGKKGNYVADTRLMVLPEHDSDLTFYEIREEQVEEARKLTGNKKKFIAYLKKVRKT